MKLRTLEIERRQEMQSAKQPQFAAEHFSLVVIDLECQVLSTFMNRTAGEELELVLCERRTRLRPELEALIKTLLEPSAAGKRQESMRIRFGDGYALRLCPLASEGGEFVALVIEADRSVDLIRRAAIRFSLTPRQIDVLLLALEGANAGEIARILHISEYTAQGYVKLLLKKTHSRNRAAMVAKVLDWETLSDAGNPNAFAG